MGPFLQLLLVVGAMSVGTFAFGSLPLALPLGRAKLRYVELIGSGLLLGAAFTVVIPEGVAAVLRSADALRRLPAAVPDSRLWRLFTDGETVIGSMLLLGFFLMFVLEQVSSRADSDHHMHHHHDSHHHGLEHSPTHTQVGLPEDVPLPVASATISTPHAGASRDTVLSPLLSQAGRNAHTRFYSSDNDSSPERSFPGLPARTSSKVLVSTLGPHHKPANGKLAQKSHSTQTLQTPGRRCPAEGPRRHSHSVHTHHPSHRHHGYRCPTEISVMIGHSHRLSTLVPAHEPGTSLKAALASIVGLLIHAFADGIAMGASASSTDEQLRWIVFGAILIHKAPTAFGLCSVLMARGLNKGDILKALALFSLCTPVGAVIVYLALQALFSINSLIAAHEVDANTLKAALLSSAATMRQLGIGATLTFSGGTFLFVAMHALEDVTDSPGPDAGVGATPALLVPSRPKGKGKSTRADRQSEAGNQEHSALWIPSLSHGLRQEGDVEQGPAEGDEQHEAHAQSPSSSSSSESESEPEREKRLRREASQVSQPTRIALVFLGSMIPKLLQMATGGHHH